MSDLTNDFAASQTALGAGGKLPKSGDFIIGVKYNASALKGATAPTSSPVTYTFGAELQNVPFDEAFTELVPKP